MKMNLTLLTFIFFLSVHVTLVAQQSGETSGSGDVTLSGTSRGADANIVVGKRANRDGVESKAIQPGDKGGRTRGSYCTAKFDNYTSWYIDCYVDGSYEGHVAPYGEGIVVVGGGNTKLYAKAEFQDGSWKSWGPLTKNCINSTLEIEIYSTYFNWNLY